MKEINEMPVIDFAPMEGITGFAFRNAHHKYYGGVSRYYTPFLNVQAESCFSRSDARDVLFENNKALLGDPACTLVPQLLTGHSETLILGIRTLAEMGYPEINWNMGCPSPTVTRRGRGAGLLAEPEKIDRILDETFSALEKEGLAVRLSVKMRTGLESAELFPELIEVLNRYPLSEIILHPRIAAQGYQGPVDEEAFAQALALCCQPLTWNGDVKCPEDMERIMERFPQVNRIMIGRGLVTEPDLAMEILKSFSEAETALSKKKSFAKNARQSENQADIEEHDIINVQPPANQAATEENCLSGCSLFGMFHDGILQGYQSYIPDEKGALARMKELWGWWGQAALFSNAGVPADVLPRALKKIKKAKSVGEYRTEVNRLLDSIGG